MFDEFARSLFQDYPEFEGLDSSNITRALSSAYLEIVNHRVNRHMDEGYNLEGTQPILRKLANALIFHVILDEDRTEKERQAAAFVAAEAIALTVDLLSVRRKVGEEEMTEIRTADQYVRVESSLLYLFARYDACASGVLKMSSPELDDTSIIHLAADWSFERLKKLCCLTLFPSLSDKFDREFSDTDVLTPKELEEETVAQLFIEIGKSCIEFNSWLGGLEGGFDSATTRLNRLICALSVKEEDSFDSIAGSKRSLIFHLATLLRLCLPALKERALLHIVPDPPRSDSALYREYLKARAIGGTDVIGRPVLWPSASEFVHECLLRQAKHAVVTMPTGSGKSFIAELAVSQSVHEGWVLYLAPTNALTEQIRGDLRKGLKELKTEIFAFIGDQEYSIFTSDLVNKMPANSVAVMTPEKCALALRLSPDTFSNCQLVIFDECHLLGDTGSLRGPVAELVLTQLMFRAPSCRFLLMSAIIQNPEQLTGWLKEATGYSCKTISIGWRPTRTLRAVLGLNNKSIQERATKAKKELIQKSEKFKKVGFNSECALAVNLQGAWQSEDQQDYAIAPIACEAPLKIVRSKRQGRWTYHWEGDRWVNCSAINLGIAFAESGIQTLIFTPANKHYPFSNGKKVEFTGKLVDSLSPPADFVGTCRILAEYELGCKSQVFSLLEMGVAIHTSLMLETEKIGSETMFRSGDVPLMFATGTLAQGLNLPAIAVVIAGSRIGDPRGQDQKEVQRRKFSQLLNAAGRAGRAGFANQGLVVAIPDEPVAFDDVKSFTDAREQVDYLQQSDDSVRVESGLSAFLDSVCENILQPNQASDVELQVVSLLAGGDKDQIEIAPILKRTYAAYLRRIAGKKEVSKENAERVTQLGTFFIEETGAPPWLTVAAQRAGIDFFLTLAIYKAWAKVRPKLPLSAPDWSVIQWRDELLRLIINISPLVLAKKLPITELKHISEEFKLIEKEDEEFLYDRELNWIPPQNWIQAWSTATAPLDAWMNGCSVAKIASIITGHPVETISTDRTAGKPIPKALSLSYGTWSSLSLIAGGFLAIAEQLWEEHVPLTLASLPMCIKYGCDSPATLAWFRFGVRLRRSSRVLAKCFPPPIFDRDEELRDWIRETRRNWLSSKHDQHYILSSIRKFITEGSAS
jgi:superfamily II DNA/RNA helicase